jgi:hypothetical protein
LHDARIFMGVFQLGQDDFRARVALWLKAVLFYLYF